MCDFTQNFKLCTCEDSSFIDKNAFVWTLYRFIEWRTDKVVGKFLPPSDKIGQNITTEWVLENLNRENCFDFEYIPQEGDYLTMRANAQSSHYLAFIYKNGQWTKNSYTPFRVKIKKIGEGILAEK